MELYFLPNVEKQNTSIVYHYPVAANRAAEKKHWRNESAVIVVSLSVIFLQRNFKFYNSFLEKEIADLFHPFNSGTIALPIYLYIIYYYSLLFQTIVPL